LEGAASELVSFNFFFGEFVHIVVETQRSAGLKKISPRDANKVFGYLTLKENAITLLEQLFRFCL